MALKIMGDAIKRAGWIDRIRNGHTDAATHSEL